MKVVYLFLRVAIAVILLQTLYFKFTAHPDSVYIFTRIGMEPYGRIGIGILELIASILLLIPSTSRSGAAMTIVILAGAIYFHITKIGIEVQGDGGLLFALAVVSFFMALIVLVFRRAKHGQ